jgi:arsenate reductase-like glutaredoxin family protein
MDTIPQIPNSWFQALAGAFAALFFWVYRRLDRKVENMTDDYVTRQELDNLFALHNSRVEAMHTQNSENFREMRLQLESVNTKLFDLSGRISK